MKSPLIGEDCERN